MGLFDLFRRMLGRSAATDAPQPPPRPVRRPKLDRLRFQRNRELDRVTEVEERPYAFAELGPRPGYFLDHSRDVRPDRLERWDLPRLATPSDLADWLSISIGELVWLTHRMTDGHRPTTIRGAHYAFQWVRKRSGGWRLIEAPKPLLKQVQSRILTGILNHVPAHPKAHGFVTGRSIMSNARDHVGKHVVVKLDLHDFYATVRQSRVIAIYRSLGFSREVAIWLSRLTTSGIPTNLPFPESDASALWPYLRHHLPQGASTSPSIANLSARSLDIRLDGMTRKFGGTYTRYADDLTFSGPRSFDRALKTFLPLVNQIIRAERFHVHHRKRKILRRGQRQTVTGVVVNERMNVSRRDFDRLKAVLTNCIRHGPQSQNRDDVVDFAAQLRGRIAHVSQLNADRGAKLLALFQRIRW